MKYKNKKSYKCAHEKYLKLEKKSNKKQQINTHKKDQI